MQRTCTYLIVLLLAMLAATHAAKGPRSSKPNVIYILADDLGVGDVGCYGQRLECAYQKALPT